MNLNVMSFKVCHESVEDSVKCIIAPEDTASSFISKIQEDILYDLEPNGCYVIEFPHDWCVIINTNDKFTVDFYSDKKKFADLEQYLFEELAKQLDTFISQLASAIRDRMK